MINKFSGEDGEGDIVKIETKYDCGEYPPFYAPMQNRLTGNTEIITVRAKCVRTCSRFCSKCNCCKFKCGHNNNLI